MSYGPLLIVVDFCNGLPTNYDEIIGYLLFPSAWGSGGRWFKSSRPDQEKDLSNR
jgi:hypothetical protein